MTEKADKRAEHSETPVHFLGWARRQAFLGKIKSISESCTPSISRLATPHLGIKGTQMPQTPQKYPLFQRSTNLIWLKRTAFYRLRGSLLQATVPSWDDPITSGDPLRIMKDLLLSKSPGLSIFSGIREEES